jgi:hypothetical protein
LCSRIQQRIDTLYPQNNLPAAVVSGVCKCCADVRVVVGGSCDAGVPSSEPSGAIARYGGHGDEQRLLKMSKENENGRVMLRRDSRITLRNVLPCNSKW